MKKKCFCLFFVTSFFLLLSFSASAMTNEEAFQINAKAYWQCGTKIQYSIPERLKTADFFKPEDVLTDVVYSDCSAFARALYQETFGIDLPRRTWDYELYINADRTSPYVIDAADQDEYTELVTDDLLVERVLKRIQVGDLILMRFNTKNPKGHIMMGYEYIYDENGNVTDMWMIHCTGKNQKEEAFQSAYQDGFTEGAVRIARLSKLLNGFYSKIKNGKSHVYLYALFRPLAAGNLYQDPNGTYTSFTISENTFLRQEEKEIAPCLPAQNDTIDISTCKIEKLPEQEYTGSAIEPSVTIRTSKGGKKLTEGIDYTVRYLDQTEPGTAVCVVTGLGAYSGTAFLRFRIYTYDLKN